jgi:23S rRNA (guanosine2251-2'-O)-methyltransferase
MIKKKFLEKTVLILPDIRSTQNVGAMFRTADAVGIDKIYLTGYTPDPVDRFGKKRKDIAKSALGAEESVPWEHKKSLTALIDKLKKDKFKIIAIEQAKNSIDYKTLRLGSGQEKIAFIVGNEVSGLPFSVLKKCDFIAEIPMKGKKESLNVSVACGIALFRILNI